MSFVYEQIESRYGFSIPEEYREMERRGWFNRQEHYKWLYDVRWISPEEIRDFEFQSYQKTEYVPFAKTARGYLYCWWPSATFAQGTPVILCPSDYQMAFVYAPHFLGCVYGIILEYASYIDEEEESEARVNIRRWIETFGSFFPSSWRETLQSIAERPLITWQHKLPTGKIFTEQGLITKEELQAFFQRDLQFPGLDKEFMWHRE